MPRALQHLVSRQHPAADGAAELPRRGFLKLVGLGGFALGLAPLTSLAQGAAPAGLKPQQQPGAFVAIARDGTVTARGDSGPAQTVGRIKLVNPPPADLRKGPDGLMRLAGGEEAPADPLVRIASGAIEGSNVNVVEAMVGMIAAARQFETTMKLLQTADQNDQRASQLLAPAR